ncbi:MAG: aldo/keto reductase [Candidatus Neomarinimicrobiota bacterium]
MEKRSFGETGHESTVAVFGAGALGRVTQPEADAALELLLTYGVNHIDVAPSYGEAEQHLRPWLAAHREHFFLNCKTLERTQDGAAAELRRSLERMGVEVIDLYQFHAVNVMAELDKVTAPGGALEAVIAARRDGLIRFIGITGHGLAAPQVMSEALRRFDFDAIMFPLNFILYSDPQYRAEAENLLEICNDHGVAVQVIKAVARQSWDDDPLSHPTWYRPFDNPEIIQRAVIFVLSQDITALATPSDLHLLPLVLEACEHYRPMPNEEQEALIIEGREYEQIFTLQGRERLD